MFKGEGKSTSSNLKKLHVRDEATRDQIEAILNSSLFYWFFIVCSYCQDLNAREINDFSIDLDAIDDSSSRLLIKYTRDLIEDLKKHSKIKKASYKKFGTVNYQEFHVRYSKSIIDKIDAVLARHYGFTQAETDFIIDFDERYRMQEA